MELIFYKEELHGSRAEYAARVEARHAETLAAREKMPAKGLHMFPLHMLERGQISVISEHAPTCAYVAELMRYSAAVESGAIVRSWRR